MRAVALLGLLLLAGCVTPAAVPVDKASEGGPEARAPGSPLGLAGTDCVWGGGHSIHTMEYADLIPEPWHVADVIEDIGAQPTYSDPGEQIYGVADTGWGNWHTNLVCKAWMVDGQETPVTLGMVLTRIEPPAFDTAPVERQYIVNVIATDSKTVNDRLMSIGWMSMGATGTLTWDGGTFHHVLATEMHGTYESIFRTKEVGPLDAGTIRLWYQVPNADETFSPVAIDMVVTGSPTHAIADPEGYFSHTDTEDHVLLLGQPQGVHGQIAGFVVSGFDVEFSWGQAPALKLEKAYEHL